MCDVTARSRRARTPPPPRWGRLYGLTAVFLGALIAFEMLATPGAVRTALQCGLALGGFGAMGLWARLNRVALDQQDWCECAATKITVRVIRSRRLLTEPLEEEEDDEAWAVSLARR